MKKNSLFISALLLIFTGCDTGSSKNVSVIADDPLYPEQWHLNNTAQTSGTTHNGTAGEDLNLQNTWETYRGNGIKVGIVDTGIELLHPDLASNIDTTLSFHYNQTAPGENPYDPTPDFNQLDDDTIGAAHGTACAGITAAIADNGAGGRGIAPEATLAGLNAFSNPEQINFADALYAKVFETELSNPGYPFSKSDQLDISSNSWADFPGNLDDEDPELIAIRDGIAKGREGKGIVYCFAAGNFRYSTNELSDNSNWYREQNNPYVISIAALDADGRYASYSNFGANILISAFGGEDGSAYPAIVTTDLTGNEGFDTLLTDLNAICYYDPYSNYYCQEHYEAQGNEYGNYTNYMNGTSAATPMTAGVVALILQANPNLTYRDVRYILATTARKNDPTDSDWTQNGAGHWINHNYGFGTIDVGAAITAATSSSYQLLDTNITKSYVRNLNIPTIDDTHPVTVEINVSAQDNMSVEFAELTVTNLLGQVEDLEIILQSPSETNSTLSHSNRILNYYGYDDIFADFTFGSVRYLDENSSGTWRLYITDTRSDAPGSQLDAVTLTLYGRNPQ